MRRINLSMDINIGQTKLVLNTKKIKPFNLDMKIEMKKRLKPI